MSITVDDPKVQLMLLKSTILTALCLPNGYGATQALLRKASVDHLISNESQQKVLTVCEPLNCETPVPVTTEMFSEIERIFAAEISHLEQSP